MQELFGSQDDALSGLPGVDSGSGQVPELRDDGSECGVAMSDPVNHPKHYNSHPAGIECIDVIEELPYNIGAAIKYIWRVGLKGNAIQDLEKAQWHIQREVDRLKKRDGGSDALAWP